MGDGSGEGTPEEYKLSIDAVPFGEYTLAMPKRRPPQEFIAEITVQDDGVIPVRPVPEWTKNKLGILWAYLSRYAIACRSARAFYFVDAMAGSGLCRVRETGEFLLGSTLIALKAEPRFTKCLSLEQNANSYRALVTRTESVRPRSVVEPGDCNQDLLRLMNREIPRGAPTFILFDPEGAELNWTTVREAALFRTGKLKAELLILLATSFLDRMLPNEGDAELHNVMALNQVFPPSRRWSETWERKRRGEISAEQGRIEHADSYCVWLRESLGYRFVAARPVTRPGSTASVYHLIFASDHPAGEDIMTHVFETMYPNESNLKFPGF